MKIDNLSYRLLILSDYITAPSYSPRLTSLLRYLHAQGWSCTLAADNLPGKEYTTDICPQVNMTYTGGKLSDKLFGARERAFTRMLLRKFKAGDFDCIFCSVYYYFPLQTAAALSRKWRIPFVVDMRDIVEQWGNTPYFHTPLPKILGLERILSHLYERHNIRARNRVLCQASAITTVSNWHQSLLQSVTTAPVSCIYNGYEEDEVRSAGFKATKQFNMTYMGRLINLQARQPELLFAGIKELAGGNDLAIHFYCEKEYQESLRQMAAKYGAEKNLYMHPFVSRNQIKDILSETSIIVALGAPASSGQHGILGTKVFEAIGAEKPFMLIPSDEDALSELIRETNIGIAARTAEDVREFVKKTYTQWQTLGYTHRAVRDKERFSRIHQNRQFEEILAEQITKKHE